ncbi:MAG: hypothetical protein ACR2IV_18695, partial [Bryobacteraceae bacterium]
SHPQYDDLGFEMPSLEHRGSPLTHGPPAYQTVSTVFATHPYSQSKRAFTLAAPGGSLWRIDAAI